MNEIIKFKNYIKENLDLSDEKDDIEDIFIQFIDEGYIINISDKYFSDKFKSSDIITNDTNNPGLSINLYHKTTEIYSEIEISNINKKIGISLNRLNKIGKAAISYLNINNFLHSNPNISFEIYLFFENKKIEISNKDGFVDFIRKFKRVFRDSSSLAARSFDIKQSKDGLILTYKQGINPDNKLKSKLKKFINDKFDPFFNRNSRVAFKYEFKEVGDEIHITYLKKGSYNTYRGTTDWEEDTI